MGIILLASVLPCTMTAQQSETPSKPASNGAPAVFKAGNAKTAPSDEVVLTIGTIQVTKSEIESMLGEQPSPSTKRAVNAAGRQRLVESYVRMILLSQQAANDHLDSSPAMRRRLEMQRARLLAAAEFDKMRSEIKVSPEDIAQYYASHQPEFDTVEVRQFLVRKRPKDSQDPDVGMSAADALSKAESIRKALASGDPPEKVNEDLGDPAVLLIDPKPRTLKRNDMIPALEKASFEAKDGGVAGPVDTPDAVLVALVFTHGHIAQKEAATEIGNKLRAQKLDAEVDDLRKKVGVWMNEDYFKKDPGATTAPPSQPPASNANPTP